MKRILLLAFALSTTFAFAQWKPAGDKMKTKWAETIVCEECIARISTSYYGAQRLV